jgi:ribosomal-protein-alanine N-acetyltransferase
VTRPTIETERLVLRPFRLEGADDVQRLTGAREIAAATLTIPHPYPAGAAAAWIASHAEASDRGGVELAIEARSDATLVGAIGLNIEHEHRRAEIGYWIGVPFWGRGYANGGCPGRARLRLRRSGTEPRLRLPLHEQPSLRLLRKIGMAREGTRRAHSLKWGEYLDSEAHAILRSEWVAARSHVRDISVTAAATRPGRSG